MQMKFDSPQIFLDCVGYQQAYKPGNCPTFWVCKNKKEGQSHFLEISVMANFKYEKTKNDVNFTWNFSFRIFTSLLW